MSLTRRLQILLDEERYKRLEEHAERRGASVAALVREAIDQLLPDEAIDRSEAGRRLLEADEMPVGDWHEIKEQMVDEMTSRSTS